VDRVTQVFPQQLAPPEQSALVRHLTHMPVPLQSLPPLSVHIVLAGAGVVAQVPALHAGIRHAVPVAGQACPHDPQLDGSDWRLVQPPAQHTAPPEHGWLGLLDPFGSSPQAPAPLHTLHTPLQAALQHTPSAQKPLAH
jgi:hypothetical protein